MSGMRLKCAPPADAFAASGVAADGRVAPPPCFTYTRQKPARHDPPAGISMDKGAAAAPVTLMVRYASHNLMEN